MCQEGKGDTGESAEDGLIKKKVITDHLKKSSGEIIQLTILCLGSRSVGSAKIFGYTDPEQRGKISTKNCKKKFLLLKPNLNF